MSLSPEYIAGMLAPMGTVADSTRACAVAVMHHLDSLGMRARNLWGYDPNPGNGEHHSGWAIDFMCTRVVGDAIADHLWANRNLYGLQHMIWRQRIMSTDPQYSPGVWVGMSDRGSVTENHYDHVHVKLWHGSRYADRATTTPQEEEDDMPYTRAELLDIMQEAILSIHWGPGNTYGEIYLRILQAATEANLKVSALQAALDASKAGASPEEIRAAIDKGVSDAMGRLQISVAQQSRPVEPPSA